MRVSSGTKPSAYRVDTEGSKAILRFAENITEKTVELDDESLVVFEYDYYEYHTLNREGLNDDVESNREKWLAMAIQSEYDELAAKIRAKRDALLAETDKEFSLDRVLQNMASVSTTALTAKLKELAKGELAKYRQELRDITNQAGFPYKVKFPNKPKL